MRCSDTTTIYSSSHRFSGENGRPGLWGKPRPCALLAHPPSPCWSQVLRPGVVVRMDFRTGRPWAGLVAWHTHGHHAVRPFQCHSLHLMGVSSPVSPPFSFFLLLRNLMPIHYSEVLEGCVDFGTWVLGTGSKCGMVCLIAISFACSLVRFLKSIKSNFPP